MEKLRRAAILSALVDEMDKQGSWCGETHIQKCVYFMQEMTSVPTGFKYIIYKHGPFSFELRDELGDMRAHFILKVEAQPYPYGPSWKIEISGKMLERQFQKTVEQYKPHIEFVASKLSTKSVAELERLSTALYISTSSNGSVTDRAKQIHELKPHISIAQALEALGEVELLRGMAPVAQG